MLRDINVKYKNTERCGGNLGRVEGHTREFHLLHLVAFDSNKYLNKNVEIRKNLSEKHKSSWRASSVTTLF